MVYYKKGRQIVNLFFLEIKKVLFKSHLILLMILLMLINIFQTYSYVKLSNEQEYRSYYKYLCDYGDIKCELEIEEIKDTYDMLNIKINNTKNDFERKSISKEEYIKRMNLYVDMEKERRGFNAFYEQYVSVLNSDRTMGFVDLYFWKGLIDLEGLDLTIIIFVLILIANELELDKNNKINLIQQTSFLGKKELFHIKRLVMIMLSSTMFILSKIQRILILWDSYSCIGATESLRSISYFQSSSKEINLITSFFIIYLLQYIGLYCFMLWSCFISQMCKKSIMVIFINLLLIIIPTVLIKNDTILFSLPIPIGLLYGKQYLLGTQSVDYGNYINTNFLEFSYIKIIIICFFNVSVAFVLDNANFLKLKIKGKYHAKKKC